jgi:CubicO group peptidase (beta-lactamase class C family)
MNAGFNGGGAGYPPDSKTKLDVDCINFALNEVPLRNPPGSEGVFEYSNDGPNLLSGIIANVTGNSTEEFAREYLFEPLGILEEETFWWNDSKGMDFGGYGFDCSPKVQAKLGMLALNDGTWNGQQIVEPNFIIDATTPQIYGYGYLIWMIASPFEGYSFIGAGGQCIYVIPEFDIVVGFTASDDPNYLPIITDYILTNIVDPPGNQIPPQDPLIPGFSLNLIFLTIFCVSAVLIIRKKKNSKN